MKIVISKKNELGEGDRDVIKAVLANKETNSAHFRCRKLSVMARGKILSVRSHHSREIHYCASVDTLADLFVGTVMKHSSKGNK